MAHGIGLTNHVMAEDLRGARGGRQKGGQNAQRRGFARSIGPDETKQIAFIYDQIQTRQGGDAAVHPGQAEGLNGGNGGSIHPC